MALNFPFPATVGQLYPSPAVAGVPVWRWDGTVWSPQGALSTKTPVYNDGSVAMAAELTLISPPVATTDAASKAYVDGIISTKNFRILSFVSSGTYTPSPGLIAAIFEGVGGGGGGGNANGGGSFFTSGGGGGGGAYARKLLFASAIGGSKVVTIGAGGSGGNPGVAGGDTYLGPVGSPLLLAKGGIGGNLGTTGALGTGGVGGSAGACIGDVVVNGGQGGIGSYSSSAGTFAGSGLGGGSKWGLQTPGAMAGGGNLATGNSGVGYGSGGSGGAASYVAGTGVGGAGNSGIMVVTEFYSQ